MGRIGLLGGLFFLAGAASAFAQEALIHPLPRSEINRGDILLDGFVLFGENTENLGSIDESFSGLGAQFMYDLDPDLAVTGRLFWLNGDIDLLQIGANLAYQVVEGKGKKPHITLFGGLGIAQSEISNGPIKLVDDTGLYFEFGAQADFNLDVRWRIVPFVGVTVETVEDTDSIFGFGGTVHFQLATDWRITGSLILQLDNLSEAWMVSIGVLRTLD